MGFEKRVLEVVRTVTDTPANFYEGTLFLYTADSEVAVQVFNALHKMVNGRIAFGRAGEFETIYDFLA